MPFGTACNRLRKSVMFMLAKRAGRDTCYRCHKRIVSEGEFSMNHKRPWLDSPCPWARFFDTQNIAFSHFKCNIGCGRKPTKYATEALRLAANRKRKKASYYRQPISKRKRDWEAKYKRRKK